MQYISIAYVSNNVNYCRLRNKIDNNGCYCWLLMLLYTGLVQYYVVVVFCQLLWSTMSGAQTFGLLLVYLCWFFLSGSCVLFLSGPDEFKFLVSSLKFKLKFKFKFLLFCTRIQPGFCSYFLFHIFCSAYSCPVPAPTWPVLAPAPGPCSFSVLSSGSGSIWASSVGPDCYQGAPDILVISLYATFDYIPNAIYINSIW